MSKYESDLYAWTREQGELLRKRAGNEIDWDNLAEEIETLGRSERSEIRSRLKVLLVHLLKWRHQPDQQRKSWTASIDEARDRIARILKDSPSLRRFPDEALADAYQSALRDRDINYLDSRDVPKTCPWTAEQVLDTNFLP
jgi:ribosomal protein L29